MAVPSVNITIEKGANFENTFTIYNSDGTPLNLSSYSAVAKLKKFPDSTTSYPFTISITGSVGRVQLTMSAETTSSLPDGRCYYDILVTSAGGTKTRVIEGMALVSKSISS